MARPDPIDAEAHGLDDAARLAGALDDLVEEALRGGRAGVERLLLERIVELGLAGAATLWTRDATGQEGRPLRGYGGPTPAPERARYAPAARVHPLGDDRCVVAVQPPVDDDRRRERRAETIEALVALAAALCAAIPCTGAGQDGETPPGPLRRSA